MGTVDSSHPPFFASTKLNAPHMREALAASWAQSPTQAVVAETGVVPAGGNVQGGFAVTASGSAGAPSVTISPGQCIIARPVGGTYVGTLPVAVTCTVDTPLPSGGQTRIDVLCALIVDGEADGGTPPQTNVLRFAMVTGTASASPAVPSVPAGYLPLWQVQVANSGSLSFTDVRTYTRAPGGLRFVNAGDTRPGSWPADFRVFASGQVDCWVNVSGTWTWVTVVNAQQWVQFTPTLYTQAGAQALGTGGSAIGRYMVLGKLMHLRYIFRAGSNMVGGWGDTYTQLPPGILAAPSEETQILAKLNASWPLGTLAAIFNGVCFINSGTNTMALYFPVSRSDCSLTTYRMSDSSAGNPGTGAPLVPNGYPLPGVLDIQGTIEIS